MSSKLSGRRGFLKDSAALVGLAAGVVPSARAQTSPSEAPDKDSKELIAYGERSHYVKSVRIPVMERMSPDDFGMTFHVLSPLQDSVGIITASSLHYVATHRGSYVPDINPQEHRLMIHGMVDRPLIFTVEELKRLPFVTRTHFLECSGNRAKAAHKTVQQTHGMTSCCEWTGVPLSLLLKEAGVQKRRVLHRGGRGGDRERRDEHSARKGHGRLSGMLRPKWRASASPARLPASVDRTRL